MRRCAFLTLSRPDGFFIDDELAYAPLRDLGWETEAVPWDRAGVDWGAFDAVVIRSPWDYQDRPEAFLAVLESIVASGARLYNDLPIVRWNLRKTYLRELEERGVAVLPTVWRDRLEPGAWSALFDGDGHGDEIVVKPQVGANADHAYRLTRDADPERIRALEATYADRPLMAQPFVRSVVEEGEVSLFWFDGTLGHAILKTPKPGDFRVQEEHGGILTTIRPGPDLLDVAEAARAALPFEPLYARADFVRFDGASDWRLMEFELIEPGLYLRMDDDAPARFAAAIDARYRRDARR